MDKDIKRKRYEKLGFKPQKENVYNELLPYAEKLDEESTQLFSDIKTNLVKSVLAHEMRPGCALWTSRLNKYIKIYGMKFSKDDHIALIKLFYELLTIPDLEPTRINKCASTLSQLLKKKYLISRDELVLNWRPLYDLCVRVMEKSKSEIGMYRCYATLGTNVMTVIRLCRIYFPANATQEILDEFRPKFYTPGSSDFVNAIEYMEIFLPLCVKPEEASISYHLWFEEFMTLWNQSHNAGVLEEHMMWLMARLSSFTIGYIDWEPYIPFMFTRFLRSFQLPVFYRQKQTYKTYKMQVSSICVWIACILNGDKNSAFFHLEKFMQTLVSYYYPANTGRWSPKLKEFLKKLSCCFVQRIHCERYRKKTWETPIPEHYKLTDDDIDRFVNIMKPCIEQAMFSNQGNQDIVLALQYLSTLRPNLIVPMILDKLYQSMDSLTEPHKLTCSMLGTIAVSRYMVQGARKNYPEGPTHVLPLLMAVLPGIDPNDIRKCLVTFNFIVHFVNMIPLVNSSGASLYYDDLTEEEHLVCEATDGFEDFVLQFFDRLFSWVESNSLDFVRLEQMANSNNNCKNKVEILAESALFTVISSVLHQSSPEIFTAALKKLYNFVTAKILEIQISGKMIAVICQGFAKVNPKETLKLFLPHLCDTIETLLAENVNIQNEEHLDAELLYNLQILSELLDARSELINYIDRLIPILDKTLHMKSLNGSLLAARCLEVMMSTLTYILPVEYRSCSTPYDTPVKDFLPIREWGKGEHLKNLKINWYIPNDKEISLVQQLLNKYLIPELTKLDQYSNGDLNLDRTELRCTFRIIISILSSHPVLPIWDEPAIHLVESVLDPWAFNLIVSDTHQVHMPDGRNVRKVIADTMHRVQRKILEIDEGDTKSISHIIQIYNILLFNKSRSQDFEYHWKNFHVVKKVFEDRLYQNKLHPRNILISRVMLQQEFRTESRSCSFTETHKQILLDLFELSVCRYSEVRMGAQMKLFSVIAYFPYSYIVLKPKIIETLQLNTQEHHERFKGCLYVLVNAKNSPIVTRHDWSFIRDLWPLIVKSQPSEKPSIVNLINSIQDAVHRFFPTIALNLVFTKTCLNVANDFAQIQPVVVDLTKFQEFIDNGEQVLKLKCQNRVQAYNDTLDALLDACINGNLHWRYHTMAVGFIKDLVHFDVKYNVKIVKYFLQELINESIIIRKIALRVILYVLIQNKPKFKKIEIDPYRIAGVEKPNKLQPGIRPDNKWLLYNSKTIPKNSIEWDQPYYVHETCIGYYTWPKKLLIYAPSDQQPNIDERFDKLTDIEKEIYNFFNDDTNLEQFFKYFSMEEKKGKDQFSAYKYLLFKNLFKLFEDKLLDKIIPYIENLVCDKNESSHRCAAETISGLIRGCKHWKYDKVEQLWYRLIPILQNAILNMCSEVVTDWGLCVAMALDSRDPKRYHWIFEYLIDDPLSNPTTFITCGRLHILQSALAQMSWRNVELLSRLYRYIKPHLSHPFQNIRDKIVGCLNMIFSKEILISYDKSVDVVNYDEFFNEVQPIFNHLYAYTLKKLDNKFEIDNLEQNLELLKLDNDEEREKAIRVFKLVAKHVTSSSIRVTFTITPEYFEMLPLVCILQSNDVDDELAPICTNFLAVLSQSIVTSQYIPFALETIRKIATCPFWSARSVLPEFLSCFVFHNMATILSQKPWILDVQALVLELLQDTQPEVRINASQVLSGLLHCQFIPEPLELLTLFKQKAKTKLKKKSNINSTIENLTNLRFRHAGVLGMCAFISSHPYDVPDYLPDVFGQLGPHLNDPQPIPTTIRKTLGDFKRTHHENWEVHKLKFTEEELAVLSDLTVPPSYYA